MSKNKKISNKALNKTYDNIYKGQSSSFFTFDSFNESRLILDMIPAWQGLDVLEIGCGEGHLAAMISFAGAKKVDAVDYSSEAIKIAKSRIQLENLSFHCKDLKEIKGKYDVIVMQGVLEHLDKPFKTLNSIISTNLKKGGEFITSSPSFLNPRGYVWMTLQLLFDVPMSLTDAHFLCPFDFEEFCRKHSYKLKVRSADQDWGSGERTIIDFNKRLRNALRDAKMDNTKVDRLLEWLKKAVIYHQTDEYSGANVAYRISI